MIRDMRRGHVPSVERLRSLCEILDLEFFVGPRRMQKDEREGAPDVLLSTLERTTQYLAQLTADAGGSPVSDDLWSVLAARRVAEFELPPPQRESTPGETKWFNVLPRIELVDPTVSMGIERTPKGNMGRVSMDDVSLQTRGLDLANCFLVEIQDGYLEPTIPNECVVLVDGASTDWQPQRIMAVRIDDDVLARRAALDDDGQRLLTNNHSDWPDAPLPASAEVVGEVRGVVKWLSRATSAGDQAEAAPALTPSQDRGNQAS